MKLLPFELETSPHKAQSQASSTTTVVSGRYAEAAIHMSMTNPSYLLFLLVPLLFSHFPLQSEESLMCQPLLLKLFLYKALLLKSFLLRSRTWEASILSGDSVSGNHGRLQSTVPLAVILYMVYRINQPILFHVECCDISLRPFHSPRSQWWLRLCPVN